MAPAKAMNLRVRPLQSVDLSFPVDGIVGAQPDIHLLGKTVKAFDLYAFYAQLSTVLSPLVWVPPKFDPAHGTVTQGRYAPLPASDQPLGWGRLKYDSRAIMEEINASILFALRAEQVKAVLDKAVALRENTWAQKYENEVYKAAQKAYNRDDANSKLSRLEMLASISKKQHDRLQTEYAFFSGEGSPAFTQGVVTASVTHSSTDSAPLKTTPVGAGSLQDWDTTPAHINANTQSGSSYTRGFEFRHPSFENDAQFERSQISLADEQLSAISAANYVSGSKAESDANIAMNWAELSTRYPANDLRAIDLDIKRLQVSYLDTFLLSPIDGVVTGVFRNIGDFVNAAQPVVRVENDTEIYLVGVLKYRGIIGVGQTISVTTSLFDNRTVSGVVASVRGHDSENELWDLLIRCGNRDAAGLPRFPINYNFDLDNATIEVT